MKHIVKIKSITPLTHDVLHFVVDKPAGFNFIPGQATDVSINIEGWKNEKRSFTFTNLPRDNTIEFMIKTYPSHNGVTNQLLRLKTEDELILHDVFGDIAYKGEGIFIAGGAGITPFISIFRDIKTKNITDTNKLIFANKTKADIILENELKEMFGNNFINILSEEASQGYEKGFITPEIIQSNMNSTQANFYVCGPPPMMKAVDSILRHLHIESDHIIKESF